nr:immunoglobulin heavy chain junction region [Mus musculus]
CARSTWDDYWYFDVW